MTATTPLMPDAPVASDHWVRGTAVEVEVAQGAPISRKRWIVAASLGFVLSVATGSLLQGDVSGAGVIVGLAIGTVVAGLVLRARTYSLWFGAFMAVFAASIVAAIAILIGAAATGNL